VERISVAAPRLVGNERKYVLDCLDTNWISSNGRYIGAFEEAFAQFCGVKYAVATNNGTSALHAALAALGLGPGDEVMIPTVTFVATANAVRYCGAKPVLTDVLPFSLNMNPEQINMRLTPRTRGLIPVHLYGQAADMGRIMEIAQANHLWVVEDAAEAHGAQVLGRKVGSIGTCGMFSFYGNKIITTGEGGMVTTDDADLARQIRLYRGQGQDPARRYWFPVVGFNYRMTNLQAAIGLAQLERINEILEQRKQLSSWYTEELQNINNAEIIIPSEYSSRDVKWMYTIYLQGSNGQTRDHVMNIMDSMGIETRPVFYPMHVLPPYKEVQEFPVAESWTSRGINLPTHELVTLADVRRVVSALAVALSEK
jgi:perosamine synthetase